MKVIAVIIERLALVILLIGGLGLLMSMFLGVGDVVGTQLLQSPLPGARELTESTMVLIVFGALTYAQIQRSHIRVELLYTRVGPRAQAAMDVFGGLMAVLFFGLLLWQATLEAMISIELDEATVGLIRFPLYPARIILAVGTALLIVRLLVDLIIDFNRLRTGARQSAAKSEMPDILLEGFSSGDDDSQRP